MQLDTAYGQTLRFLSRGKLFAHPETLSQPRSGNNSSETEGSEKPQWLAAAERWAAASNSAGSPPSVGDLTSDSSSDEKLKAPEGNGVVGWYGEKDPANPQEWSSSYKAFVAGLICVYTFSVYLGSAIYTPSIPGVMQQFNVSYIAADLGLALFVFGYGAGAMVFSPLAEIPSVGRNWIYIITFFIYLLLTVGTALAPSYGSLMALRLLCGLFASPALATGGATLQDLYSIVKFPYGIALWVAAASMGPALGPVMGGFAAEAKGWRWPLWIQVWLSGPILIIMIFCLPETSADNILLRRARRLRALTGISSLRSQSEIDQAELTPRKVLVESMIRPLQIAVLDPGTGFLNLYVSVVYGIYYSFFESFPLIYPVYYGFGLGTSGLTFVTVVLTTGLGAAGYMYYIYYHVEPKIAATGKLPRLESRLIPAIPASILMPIGLFLYGWTSRASIHWIVSLIGVGIYSIGFYVFLQCILLYVPLTYPKYAASLLAANDFCRSSVAAGLVMAGHPMFVNLGIGPGVSLLAGLAALCVLPLLLLYRYGAYLRSQSKFIEMSPEERAELRGHA